MALTMTLTSPITGAGIRPMRMFGDHDLRIAFVSVTFDSTYPSGGYNFDPTSTTFTAGFSGVALKMFKRVLGVFVTPAPSAGAPGVMESGPMVSAYYDITNSKLHAVSLTAGTEFKSASNLSAYTVTLMIVGT